MNINNYLNNNLFTSNIFTKTKEINYVNKLLTFKIKFNKDVNLFKKSKKIMKNQNLWY